MSERDHDDEQTKLVHPNEKEQRKRDFYYDSTMIFTWVQRFLSP